MRYPRSFSHIGLSVPDLEAAVKFYSEVMGWYVVMQPSIVTEETDTAIGIMCQDVFGEGYEEFEIAHMVTSDGIGIELFQFKQNEAVRPVFNHVPTGMFHFSVQDPDIEGLVEKIVANSGFSINSVNYSI